MAEYGHTCQTFAGKAAVDFSALLYHVARYSAADTFNVASNASAFSYAGVILSTPKADQNAVVGRGGEMKIVAGEAISANVLITHNGSGRAAPVASGASSMVIGMALEAASADGHIIRADIYATPYPFPKLAV